MPFKKSKISLVLDCIYFFDLGCLFHFGQCVWRQVQSKDLSRRSEEDEVFRLNVRRLVALADNDADDLRD